eukprot:2590119-Pyramimonas_sp.AAC.1
MGLHCTPAAPEAAAEHESTNWSAGRSKGLRTSFGKGGTAVSALTGPRGGLGRRRHQRPGDGHQHQHR